MANDGKIYITISDRRFGTNKAEADEQNKLDKEKEKKDPIGDFAKHSFFNLIEGQAKQAVSYTVNNIGNFTGNYIAQQQAQNALSFLNNIISVGASAFAGFKMTGSPIGAVIAASVSLIGKGITTGQQLYSGYIENVKMNRDIAQLRTRAGLNSTNNGSRGTEY